MIGMVQRATLAQNTVGAVGSGLESIEHELAIIGAERQKCLDCRAAPRSVSCGPLPELHESVTSPSQQVSIVPNMTRPINAFVLFVFVLVISPAAHAQFETARSSAPSRTTPGAVVPGATVTLTNLETGVASTQTTDAQRQLRVRHRPRRPVQGDRGAAGLRDRASPTTCQVSVGARQRVDLTLRSASSPRRWR